MPLIKLARLLLLGVITSVCSAQTFQTIFAFTGHDGGTPGWMTLSQGTDGNFYGTTEYGGANPDGGTVFKITPDGTITTLYSFCAQSDECPTGSQPSVGVILAEDGTYWGSTYFGDNPVCLPAGCGNVFQITPKGEMSFEHSFQRTDGGSPRGSLVQDANGNLYGTTEDGGNWVMCAPGGLGCGTIFEITPNGTFNTLHLFSGTPGDGANPVGGLIQASNGNFYGTTSSGGHSTANCSPSGCGTVYRMTPKGVVTVIHSFCQQPDCVDGGDPVGSLVEGSDGALYGTTSFGGPSLWGTVFKLTPEGQFTILYNFCSLSNCSDGGAPEAALIQATDGNFYGTTTYSGNSGSCRYGCGTLFRMTPQGELTTLYSFEGTPGFEPAGGLLQATNGLFCGSTNSSLISCYTDCGTIFSLDMGLGPFVALQRDTGKIGQTAGILGQGLKSTTAVSFNRVPASFTIVSDTYLTATVPVGVTTGYIEVTTSGGSLTSNKKFRVIP